MSKKLLVTIMVIFLVMGIAGAAAASNWGGMGGKWAGKDFNPPILDLDLSAEQRSQLQELNESSFLQTQNLRIALSEKMYELRKLWFAQDPDEEAIAAKKEEVIKLRQELSEIAQENRASMNNILTPEQQEKLGGMHGHGKHGRMGTRNNAM
ncbi:MAG: Spy/CpxP family protein refolding chaperone [Bacillota bacterium]